MAVFTPVSTAAAAAFLARYELGALRGLSPIKAGVENTNYRLVAEAGAFALTLFERRADPSSVPFLLNFAEHLALSGLPVGAALRDRAGRLYSPLEGKPATLTPWLAGAPLAEPTPAEAAAGGALLARMHRLGEGFPLELDNPYGPDRWAQLIEACGKAQTEAVAPLLDMLEAELICLQQRWPASLPKGAVHADYFPDNVMMHAGALSGVIDFGFACTDFFAYDLAIGINAWGFRLDGAVDRPTMRAFLQSYLAHRPLTRAEAEALPLLCRGAALRFTATRLYDLLHHDPAWLVQPKDPAAFAARLAFHHTVTGLAAYLA